MNTKRASGDYQTPQEFAGSICMHLARDRGIKPAVVLEPACGTGSFIKAGLSFNAGKYYGIEISSGYYDFCRKEIRDSRVEIINEDFFGCSLDHIERDSLLVIGNPPWVNSSTLSALGTESSVHKSNFKGARGIDAMTGAGDFDICEAFILRILDEFKSSNTTVALLCKTSVARDVFLEIKRRDISFRYCEQIEVDAMRVFGVSASACLLLLQLSAEECHPDTCSVYGYEDWNNPVSVYVCRDGKIFSMLPDGIPDYDGHCCFEWRQGVKHDCSRVMELTLDGAGWYTNGYGETVSIEPDLVYPLAKSSTSKQPVIDVYNKFVIVAQKKAGEDTSYIRTRYPRTWEYLENHRDVFLSRKSSIYRAAPEYGMFGVGEYSYSRYKVAVSGFYKDPVFALLSSPDGRPVMTDDTCYFVAFGSYDEAYTAMLYMNTSKVRSFLQAISFSDAKRPYSKKVLERIDFSRICRDISYDTLKETESGLGLPPYLTSRMAEDFCKKVSLHSNATFA